MGNFLGKCVLQDQIHKCCSAGTVLCFVLNLLYEAHFLPLLQQHGSFVVSALVLWQREAQADYSAVVWRPSLTGVHSHVPLMPFAVLRVHLDHGITHWLLWSCLLSVPWEELGGRKPGKSQLLQDSSTMCHLHIVLAIEQTQSVWQMISVLCLRGNRPLFDLWLCLYVVLNVLRDQPQVCLNSPSWSRFPFMVVFYPENKLCHSSAPCSCVIVPSPQPHTWATALAGRRRWAVALHHVVEGPPQSRPPHRHTVQDASFFQPVLSAAHALKTEIMQRVYKWKLFILKFIPSCPQGLC